MGVYQRKDLIIMGKKPRTKASVGGKNKPREKPIHLCRRSHAPKHIRHRSNISHFLKIFDPTFEDPMGFPFHFHATGRSRPYTCQSPCIIWERGKRVVGPHWLKNLFTLQKSTTAASLLLNTGFD